jgi:hypothetical protein
LSSDGDEDAGELMLTNGVAIPDHGLIASTVEN